MGLSAKRYDGAGEVEGSVVYLARVDAWVVTLGKCSTEREARRGQRQKLYADTRVNIPGLPMNQLSGSERVFVQHCVVDWMTFKEGEEMTHLEQVLSSSERYPHVDGRKSGSIFAMS